MPVDESKSYASRPSLASMASPTRASSSASAAVSRASSSASVNAARQRNEESQAARTPTAPVGPALKRDDEFFLRTVFLQAGDTLFNIPRSGLPSNSNYFDSLFSLDFGGAGSNLESPIRLDADITADDFRSLLKITYRPSPAADQLPALTVDQWMSALKLAKRWSLGDVRDKAVSGLSLQMQHKTPIEKILLAKKYDVARWFEEGLTALASFDKPIDPAIKKQLGWEIYARLMDVRERGRTGAWRQLCAFVDTSSSGKGKGVASSCPHCDFTHSITISGAKSLEDHLPHPTPYGELVKEEFGKELHGMKGYTGSG